MSREGGKKEQRSTDGGEESRRKQSLSARCWKGGVTEITSHIFVGKIRVKCGSVTHRGRVKGFWENGIRVTH